jgi:hypothetical protein
MMLLVVNFALASAGASEYNRARSASPDFFNPQAMPLPLKPDGGIALKDIFTSWFPHF